MAEPKPNTPKIEYSKEFLSALKTDAENFKSQGYSQEKIQAFIDKSVSNYNSSYLSKLQKEEEKKVNDQNIANMPDWAKEAQVEERNKVEKMNFFQKTASVIRHIGETEFMSNPSSTLGFSVINPYSRDQQKDVITYDMVKDVDNALNGMLDENGNVKKDINVSDYLYNTKKQINEKNNPVDYDKTSRNIDILMDEAFSEIISSDLEKTISKIERTETKDGKFIDKRDILLLDPNIIADEKSRYVDMGYSGESVDRAFDKVLNIPKREIFFDHFVKSIIDDNAKSIDMQSIQGELTNDQKKNISKIKEDIYDNNSSSFHKIVKEDAYDRAKSLFNKNEYERMQLNVELQNLLKQGGTEEDQEKIRLRIDELDKKLDNGRADNVKRKIGSVSLNILSNIDKEGNVSPAVKITPDKFTRMYDVNGKKIMNGNEDEEEQKKQKAVNTEIDNLESIKNIPERLYQEMMKSDMILLDIENAINDLQKSTFNNKGWYQTASDDQLKSAKRQIDNMRSLLDQETIRFEAVSRMYLLNENVAMQDKNMVNYLEDGIKSVIPKNVRPLMGSINPSAEQIRDYTRPIYNDLGIDMDSEEYKKTEPDVTREIVSGSLQLTDFAIKMIILNKVAGAAGIPTYLQSMKKVMGVGKEYGVLGKISDFALEGLIEEGKFRVVGGNAGAGASFYVAGKAFPTIKTGNKALDVVWNGFIKNTAGMAMSMEAVSNMDAAYDALANNKDLMRTLEDNFGTLDEAQRRFMVELITAAPFGFKAIYERGQLRSYNQEFVENIAKKIESKAPEAAQELRMMSYKLGGDTEAYQHVNDYVAKAKALNDAGVETKGKKLKEIDELYKKGIEEGEVYDVIGNAKVSVFTDNYFNPKLAFDEIDYEAKIDLLKKNGYDVNNKTIDEVNTIFKKTIEELSDTYGAGLYNAGKPESYTDTQSKKLYKPYDSEKSIKEERNTIQNKVVAGDNFVESKKKYVDNIAAKVDEVKNRVGKDKFNEVVERFVPIEKTPDVEETNKTTIRNKNAVDVLLDDIYSNKTKSGTKKAIDDLNNIIHKVELVNRSGSEKLDYITRVNPDPQGIMAITSDFKNKITSATSSSKAVISSVNSINEMVRERVKNGDYGKNIKATEVREIIKKIPDSMSAKSALKRLTDINDILSRVQSRYIRENIDNAFKKYSPKVSGGKKTQEKISYIAGSKMDIASTLFKSNSDKAKRSSVKLQELIKTAKDGYEKSLLSAQLEALKYTGERELALERQAELEYESTKRELSLQEKLEYEMLNMVDGKRMTLNDVKRAEETLKSIESSGRTVEEARKQFEVIKAAVDIELALKTLGVSEEEIKRMTEENIKPESVQKGKDFLDSITKSKVGRAVNKFGMAHESFKSMMERISADAEGRDNWEGFFHSFADDFYRAREAENSELHRMLFDVREGYLHVTDMTGRDLDKLMRSNSKEDHVLKINMNGGIRHINDKSVDQVGRYWQMLHNPDTWNNFRNMGWGVKDAESKRMTSEEAKELVQQMEDFIIENGGKESLAIYKYQMEEVYPKLYSAANEIYRAKHGVDLGYTPNYVPEIFEKGVRFEDVDGERKEVTIDGFDDILKKEPDFFIASVSPTFVKVNTKAGNIKYDLKRGGNEVLQNYIGKLAHYRNFQEPIDRARRVLQSPEVKNALKIKYGDNAINDMINKSLKDIANDVAGGDKLGFLTTVKNNFVVANLGANLILFPKQMMSVTAYRAGLKGASQEAAYTKNFTTMLVTKEGWDIMSMLNKGDLMTSRKRSNSFDQNLLEERTKALQLFKDGKVDSTSVRDTLLIMTKLGDRGAILLAGGAFYKTKFDTYKKSGYTDTQAKQRAYEDFVKFTKLTQQSGYMEDLDHIQRWGTIGKYMTLFQNTPHQYLRMEMSAIRNMVKNGNEGQRSRAIRDLIVFHLIMPMTFRAAQQGFYLTANGDESEGKDRTTFLEDPDTGVLAMMGSFGYTFAAGEIGINLFNYLAARHAFEFSLGGVAQDVVDAFQDSYNVIAKYGDLDVEQREFRRIMDGTSPVTWSDIMKVLGFMSEVGGIPGVSIANLSKGIYEYTTNRTDDIRSIFGYSQSVRGYYARSQEYNLMSKFFDVSIDKGEAEFTKYIIAHTDYGYFQKNSQRLLKEFRMYRHFGGYNNDVNYLYHEARTSKEKAEFLLKLKYGKWTMPATISSAIRSITSDGMSDAQFNKYISEMLSYGVIDTDVIIEMKNIELGIRKKINQEFRKSVK